MNNYNKEILDILRWSRMGVIACRIAERIGVPPPLQALKDFYRSDTCRKFHDRSTGLYIQSDNYIADDYLTEMGLQRR
ncbi:MAG: DUF3791 domain-containing protein [Duncaniella sp.]|nr:DUF3791 domain-containing protein [Duncaniella sp.]